jgi:hypothetical protein
MACVNGAQQEDSVAHSTRPRVISVRGASTRHRNRLHAKNAPSEDLPASCKWRIVVIASVVLMLLSRANRNVFLANLVNILMQLLQQVVMNVEEI